MYTNAKMSVFNRTKKDGAIKYKKHVIDNVFWDDTESADLSIGLDKNNNVIVFVPFNKNDLSEYQEPKEYDGTGWTFKNGDFIIKGNVSEDEVLGIKELATYETFEITSSSKKEFGSYEMQHFEIKGK